MRLKYIDAPESKQTAFIQKRNSGKLIPIGLNSKLELEKLILNKSVEVYFKKRDRYKRILGEIFYHNESINLKMIKNGQAVIYWFAKFETLYQRNLYFEDLMYAKKNFKGLWKYQNFRDPYKWRKRLKRKSNRRSNRLGVSSK